MLKRATPFKQNLILTARTKAVKIRRTKKDYKKRENTFNWSNMLF